MSPRRRDPRVDHLVRLQHVKGERGVPRALHDKIGHVTAVWQYAGGLERLRVCAYVGDEPRMVWCNPNQVVFITSVQARER